MKLPELNSDNKFLKSVRYETGYNPFSIKFNKSLNDKLYKKAVAGNAKNSTLNLIRAGAHFNTTIHEPLFDELKTVHQKINLSSAELLETFIAFINEQELLNQEGKIVFFNSLQQLTALDLQHASTTREDMPQNPQNFTALSEAITEIGNLIYRYLRHAPDYEPKSLPIKGQDLFDFLTAIMKVTNKYYNLQAHYDCCLFMDGDIEIEPDKIYFDACTTSLYLIHQIAITIIENQRLNRMNYFKHNSYYTDLAKQIVLSDSSPRTLKEAIVENGFIKYRLKKRTEEDYGIYLDYLVSIIDYYPFYYSKPLVELSGLTINQLLRLYSELSGLISRLYFKGHFKYAGYDIQAYKRYFLPKIKHSVLKSYLLSVTRCSEKQIETFIKIITINNSTNPDLFCTQLINRDDYYFFPYYAITHPNYFCLIDYWLEQAGESLDHRGSAFEKYLKTELLNIQQEECNKFSVIFKSKFIASDDSEEQIDLLIETKNSIIVGEVKCVKYPMQNRDYYGIYADVLQKAAAQLDRKAQFLQKHHLDFSSDISMHGKKIVKVIILNFPFFISTEVRDIPVSDSNLFLAYFKSGRMVARSFDNDKMQEEGSVNYYSTEDEFCDNLESYLQNHPMVTAYLPYFEKRESSYQLPGLPVILFSTIQSIKGTGNMAKI